MKYTAVPRITTIKFSEELDDWKPKPYTNSSVNGRDTMPCVMINNKLLPSSEFISINPMIRLMAAKITPHLNQYFFVFMFLD